MPKRTETFGSHISGFNQLIWDDYSTTIVQQRNYNKFNQNPSLLNALEATVDTTLVEASPYDSIWEIALRQDDPRSLRRETWLGQNKLGQILTNLRDNVFLEFQTLTILDFTLKPIHAQEQEPEQVQNKNKNKRKNKNKSKNMHVGKNYSKPKYVNNSTHKRHTKN